MRIAVVGLGKLGLPLAAAYLAAGHEVIGCDISGPRLELIERLDRELDAEPGVLDALRDARASGRWSATLDVPTGVSAGEAVVVIVPVHADGLERVDLSILEAALRMVGDGLARGALVVVESTVPVGTTRGLALPLLERGERRHGGDLTLAYSPERVSVGRVFEDLRSYPKIVGGIDDEATRRAAAFYHDALGVRTIEVANAETAEFVKLVETTYRDVNIALANSFAIAADSLGLDVTEAIAAANSQPYSHVHSPGIGVGGNCIPVYPYLYAASTKEGTEIPLLARSVNDAMVDHAVRRLARALDGTLEEARILFLGITYREGVKDVSNSPALRLADRLRGLGATVLGADPLLNDADLRALGLVPTAAPTYAPADAVVVHTYAAEFGDMAWLERTGARVVLDGRNVLDARAIRERGVRYVGIGR